MTYSTGARPQLPRLQGHRLRPRLRQLDLGDQPGHPPAARPRRAVADLGGPHRRRRRPRGAGLRRLRGGRHRLTSATIGRFGAVPKDRPRTSAERQPGFFRMVGRGAPAALPAVRRQGLVPGLVPPARALPDLRLQVRAHAGLRARRGDDEHDRDVRPARGGHRGRDHRVATRTSRSCRSRSWWSRSPIMVPIAVLPVLLDALGGGRPRHAPAGTRPRSPTPPPTPPGRKRAATQRFCRRSLNERRSKLRSCRSAANPVTPPP